MSTTVCRPAGPPRSRPAPWPGSACIAFSAPATSAMAIGIRPLRQSARGVIGQAGIDELAMLGIDRLAPRARHQFSARRRVMPGSDSTSSCARSVPRAAWHWGMYIADAHLADLQQVIDGLLVALLFEEVTERARHFATDVRHALEQRPRQMADQVPGRRTTAPGPWRCSRQRVRCEREQQAFQRGGTTGVDCCDQVIGPRWRSSSCSIRSWRAVPAPARRPDRCRPASARR